MQPSSIQSSHLLNMTISQLFNPTTNNWNRELITSIMNTQDKIDIFKLPLHSRATSETVIWNASPNGAYTVKSVYKMCLSLFDHRSNYHVTGDWKLIWPLCSPSKIKHFCWRMLRHCLPTQFNLQSRGV